ncbi:HD-GYP domain-containing protein [Planobispora rosea]|uniref:HD-GYP domain-containing protein n=1 Tax=Planobispora rosea TaxID=35762 RepID=UPI00083AA1E0|nr:HD domain-containing phosphohydrolase [Planobispora rosea]
MSIDELIRHLATYGTDEDERAEEAALARFTAAAQRTDTDPSEEARIGRLAEAVDAELAAYDHGLAALDHGDAEAAQTFLLQALPTGGQSTTSLVSGLLSTGPREAIALELHQKAADLRAERLIVNAAYRRQLTGCAERTPCSPAPRTALPVLQSGIEDLTAVLLVAMEDKDPYTLHHSQRIGQLSALLGRQIGLTGDQLAAAYLGGLLHDIGKLAVPATVLTKTGALTEGEFQLIQAHVTHGPAIVGQAPNLAQESGQTSIVSVVLDQALDGIRYHHEHFDGRGYLTGLAGHDIPHIARLIAVVDAFDAMTTTRYYRPAWPPARAVAELRRHSGRIFDPVMVEAFLTVMNEDREHIEHLLYRAHREHPGLMPHGEQEADTPASLLQIIERR